MTSRHSFSAAVVAVAIVAMCAVGDCGRSIPVHRKPHVFTATTAGSVAPAANRHTVVLDGGVLSLGAYYTNITIGTPPVTFEVLIDTASSNLAVALNGCASCGKTTAYEPSASSTVQPMLCGSSACNTCNLDGGTTCLYQEPYCALNNASMCGGGISYGGSASFISGQWFTDEVSMGGLTTAMTLLAIDQEYPADSLTGSGAPFEGIFGLAYGAAACNPTCVGTWFGDLVAAGAVDNVFGMCLDPKNGGMLDLGFVDTSKFSGSLAYVPVIKEGFYFVEVKDLRFNGTSIGLPPAIYGSFNDAAGSFIDSGAGTVMVAPEILAAIQGLWQSAFCHLPGVCGSSTIFSGTCLTAAQAGNLSAFPDLELVLGGEDGDVELRVSASSYFQEANNQWCFTIQSIAGMSVMIGDIVLENYYVVFDRANTRVGFAPIDGCL